MSAPDLFATRTRRPPSRLTPTRVVSPDLGSTSITLDRWMGPSVSMMPPISCERWVSRSERGRVWRFWTFMPSTKTRWFLGSVRSTRPVLPRSLPDITLTVSSLRILIATSEHLRGERDDLHEVAVAELAGHRAEDARAAGVVLGVDEDGCVLVEGDVGAVVATELLLRANDDRLDDLALAHAAVRNRLLDGSHDHVAHTGIAPAGASRHADAQDLAGAAVVGHLEAGFLLNHPRSSVRIGTAWACENCTISPSPALRRGASAWSC